jgi:hypothetical protein
MSSTSYYYDNPDLAYIPPPHTSHPDIRSIDAQGARGRALLRLLPGGHFVILALLNARYCRMSCVITGAVHCASEVKT